MWGCLPGRCCRWAADGWPLPPVLSLCPALFNLLNLLNLLELVIALDTFGRCRAVEESVS